MVLGDGKFLAKADIDEYCHNLRAGTRLKGAPDCNWREFNGSQNSTVHFKDYQHNTDVKFQFVAIGTNGRSNWSTSIFAPID